LAGGLTTQHSIGLAIPSTAGAVCTIHNLDWIPYHEHRLLPEPEF
jgi:hypothetical protein